MSTNVRAFSCPDCKIRCQLVIDGEHLREEDGGPGYIYCFGHCVNCGRPGLLEEWNIDDPINGQQTQLYPHEYTPFDVELPQRVAESYTEALKCRSADAWLAMVVMIRRTLEAVGKEFDPNAKNLNEGLKIMKSKGIISDELERWGNELRFIGNIGAHPTGEPIVKDDALDALGFLEAIVDTIYRLRPRFTAMSARRSAAKKPKPPPGNPREG